MLVSDEYPALTMGSTDHEAGFTDGGKYGEPVGRLEIVAALAGMAPYLLAFVPAFVAGAKQKSEAAVRKHRFEKDAVPEGEAFHSCESCGATELTHPEREIRVTAEDRELCDQCRSPKLEE